MSEQRSCAYCGGSRQNRTCKCRYNLNRKRKDGLNGGICVQVSNWTAETTLAEMLKSISDTLPVSIKDPENIVGTWQWSFTRAATVSKEVAP